jgi:hypothetical protein
MLQKKSVVIIKISASLLIIASLVRRPTFSSPNNTFADHKCPIHIMTK